MDSPIVYVPLVSPMDARGQVCEKSVGRLVEFSGDIVAGYIACLTSGEGWRLSDSQWERMLVCLRDAAPSHTVIAGIERPSTAEVIELGRIAEKREADGIMITTPFGSHVSQQEMLDHYRAVHDAVGLDIYIYNESDLSENTVQPETLIDISALPRVKGIKESGASDVFVEVADTLTRNGLKIFQGWEDRLTNSPFAHGTVCSLSNLHPEICLEAMKRPCESIHNEVLALCDKYNLFAEDWYRHIKNHLADMGIISTGNLVAES